MPSEAPDETSPGYHQVTWAGSPLYQCDTCHFNTPDLDTIVDHVEMATENNQRLADELGVEAAEFGG